MLLLYMQYYDNSSFNFPCSFGLRRYSQKTLAAPTPHARDKYYYMKGIEGVRLPGGNSGSRTIGPLRNC